MSVLESYYEISDKYKLRYLSEIGKVEHEQSVLAAVSYASYLNHWGLHPDNYVLFFRAMEVPNRYVIDALTEGRDLEHMLDAVAPSHGLIDQVFNLLGFNKRGGIYEKVLIILLGFLNKVYRSPQDGYDIYAPNVEQINDLAKFLDEEKGHSFPVNRIMLDILKHLGELDENSKEGPKYDMAKHCGKIRSNFLDSTRRLEQSIPEVLLQMDPNFTDGIQPPYSYGE